MKDRPNNQLYIPILKRLIFKLPVGLCDFFMKLSGESTDDYNPDSNVIVGHLWPTTKCHQLPVMVAHHTDVQLIVGGPLAELFTGGGHRWSAVY